MYVNLGGFSTRLTDNITQKSVHLPIPEAAYSLLLEHLEDRDYSFLEIRDGSAIEYVKVMNICGKIVIERGAEQTNPLAFRCGTGVSFQLTMGGIKSSICQMEDCNGI